MQIDTSLIAEIKAIITAAREKAVKAVDSARLIMYWQIGKKIFDEEQKEKDRAEYGEFLIKMWQNSLNRNMEQG